MIIYDKWIDRASLLGAAVAINMYALWAKNPKNWPRGFKDMKSHVVSMAEDQVFIQMPSRIRSRPEIIAAAKASASETANAFIAVYKAKILKRKSKTK